MLSTSPCSSSSILVIFTLFAPSKKLTFAFRDGAALALGAAVLAGVLVLRHFGL